VRHERTTHRPSGFLRGSERWRLASALLLLVILAMTITQLSKRGTPPETDNARTAKAKTDPKPPKPAKLPEPTGPTDEDREQAEEAEYELQAVGDGGLRIGVEEMPIYERMVFWVSNQSFDRLWQRGERNPAYTYLIDDASNRRQRVISLEVDVRLIRDAGKTSTGVPLREVFAASNQSLGRLYDLIVVDLPKPYTLDKYVSRPARFTGYFLKVKDFESAVTKPGQKPERAPVLIGRLEWAAARPHEAVGTSDELRWAAIILGVAGVGVVLWLLFFRRKRAPAGISTPGDKPAAIDAWLERGELPSGNEDS
jgi:hypothetical protein